MTHPRRIWRLTAALPLVVALIFGTIAIAQSTDPRTELQAAQVDIDQAQALQLQEDAELASAEAHIQAALAALPTSTTATTLPPTTSSTTSTTIPPTTTTSTIQPPTTTSTIPPTTTTAVPPTTTTIPTGTYGTSGTGPGLEPCTTTGIAVTTSAAVTSAPQNSTILMRAGTYVTGFTVPQGSTVKPYNCELVQINDNINVNNNSTVAGLRITANADGWALRITGRTNVEIRNSVIKGGTTEAIRVDGASNNVRILANQIDGGQANHTVKVTSNSGGGTPTNVVLRNNLLTKIHFGGGEDLLQLEGHGVVVVDHNTFRDNPSGEDGMDVKSGGGVTITGNLFDGPTINFECLLVQGGLQPMLVAGNKIDNCFVSLGAHPEANLNPSWDFNQNLLANGATLRLRRSFDAEMNGNTWTGGGAVILGTSTSGDYPRNAVFRSNNFGAATWNVNNGSSTFVCDGSNGGAGPAGTACN